MITISPAFGSKKKGTRSSHDVRPLFESLNIDYTLEPLEFGDFAFSGNGPNGRMTIGVELKTIDDFVTSMLSGRLDGHQIPGLTDPKNYGRSYVIIEGVWKGDRRSGLMLVPRGMGQWRQMYIGRRPVFWRDIQRFITSIEEQGVRMRYTRSQFETVQMIAHVLQAFWQKPYDEHHTGKVLYEQPLFSIRDEPSAVKRIRRVAKALDAMIGWERSKAVAQTFRSVEEMINARREQWAEIKGIGDGIAGEVVKAIREKVRTVSDSTSKAGEVRGSRAVQGSRAHHRSARHSREHQTRE